MDNDWIDYHGEYGKMFYDLLLTNGVIVYDCYPNAGTFHTPDGLIIEAVEISKFKPSDMDENDE